MAKTVVSPNRAELASASITTSSAGTAVTVLTTTVPSVLVSLENTTNAELMFTKDGVDFKRVPAASFRVFDLKNNDVMLSKAVWGVYRIGTPSSGVVEVIATPYR